MSEEKHICKATWDVLDLHDKNVMKFLAVGCWGVYCEEGKKTIIKKKNGKCKHEPVERGQGTVSNIIDELIKKGDIEDLFLAGDNIYHKSIDDSKVKEELKKCQDDDNYNHYDIDKQLKNGFFNCFLKSNIDRYYAIAGNHDVEKCDILQRQLDFEKWHFKLFYSVKYSLATFDIHFMMIDTNILELFGNQEFCNIANSEYLKQQQMSCVKSETRHIDTSLKPTWRIMIGHIPYKALGHKSDKCIVDNSELFTGLIDIYKPHIYISADEHNQQFLTEIVGDTNVALVVAGSGGTAQDDVKTCNRDNNIQITLENKTINIPYSYTAFGIPLFQVTNESIVIDYYIKENNSIKSNFNVEVYYNHSIKTSIPQ